MASKGSVLKTEPFVIWSVVPRLRSLVSSHILRSKFADEKNHVFKTEGARGELH